MAARHSFLGTAISILLLNGSNAHAAHAAPAAAPVRLEVALEAALPDVAIAMGSGDFDADGRADLVMATATGDVYVALNPGGDLASWPWSLVDSVPLGLSNDVYSGLKVADLDGDGLSDVLIFGDEEAPGTCGAAVLTSLGDGNFASGARSSIVPPTAEDVVFGCTEAELGDYDGNGAQDVAIAYAYQPIDWFNGLLGAVNVFLGTGGGGFEAPAQYLLADDPAPYVSFAMTQGDFDGDGHTDLGFGSEVRYLSGPVAWRVETLRGDGSGRFLPGAQRAFDCTWCELELARAADFDGDGRDDLLLVPTSPEDFPSPYPILLFSGEEGGTPSAPEEIGASTGTVGVEARDVTADGLVDVLLLGDVDHVTLLEGRGDGSFAAPRGFVVGRGIVSNTLADLDSDGHSELVMQSTAPIDGVPLFEMAFAGSNGGFALPQVSPVPSGYAELLAPPADFDGDGDGDVLAIDFGQLTLMLGTGDGRFVPGASTPTDVSPWPMPVADLNGDGRLDLVQAAGDGFAVSVGLDDGTFASTPPAAGRSPRIAALGDIDADGHPDLVASEWPGEAVDIYLGDGALGFTRAASLPVAVYVSALVLADVNGDGALDLFVGAEGVRQLPDAGSAGRLVSPIFLGDGHGAFAAGPALDLAGGSFRVQDVDADGALDVVGTDAICFGDGAGNFAPAEPLPSAGAWWIELADLDGDGISELLFQRDGLMVARGGPDGRFEAARRLTAATGWRSVGVGQLAGSSQPDLVALHPFTADDTQLTELVVARNVTSPACGVAAATRAPPR